MSFITKLWKDRLSAFPKRFKMTEISSDENSKIVELELQDGTVLTQGDRFNAATMNDLESRIAAGFNSVTAGVTSFNSREGDVTPSNTDYSSDMIEHTNTDTTTSTVEAEINGIKANKVDNSQLLSGGSSGVPFIFDSHNGVYGWNESEQRGADTFHPFRGGSHTETEVITTKTTTDLGEIHDIRYIDTTGVANVNTETYTPTTRNAALDMGASNAYRYVNTNSVPNSNSTTYTPTSRSASLDMGATNTYRYVNTNSVPNTNSGTYTFPANDTGATKDLGATNTYRYVNAGNVYTAGKKSQMSYEVSFDLHVWAYARSSGAANIGAANVQNITLKIDGNTVFSNGVLSEASSDRDPVLYYDKTGNYNRT